MDCLDLVCVEDRRLKGKESCVLLVASHFDHHYVLYGLRIKELLLLYEYDVYFWGGDKW